MFMLSRLHRTMHSHKMNSNIGARLLRRSVTLFACSALNEDMLYLIQFCSENKRCRCKNQLNFIINKEFSKVHVTKATFTVKKFLFELIWDLKIYYP
jgi:hypothetical protein